MKSTFIALAALAFLCSQTLRAGDDIAAHKFVGLKMCSPCHKGVAKGKIFEIWQGSKHANAYKTLMSDAAKAIAEKKGLTKPAHESPECLKCHVTAAGVGASLLAPSFNMKDGVQCESCHGAGNDYKGMTVMKDPAKAVAAGLILGKNDPKVCTRCHNEESPSYKEFKYEEYWSKIKHPLPKK